MSLPNYAALFPIQLSSIFFSKGEMSCDAQTPMDCWEKGCLWQNPEGLYEDMIAGSYRNLAEVACAQLASADIKQASICDAICPLEGLTACYKGSQDLADQQNVLQFLCKFLISLHVQA